jgi:hypothetical protein
VIRLEWTEQGLPWTQGKDDEQNWTFHENDKGGELQALSGKSL